MIELKKEIAKTFPISYIDSLEFIEPKIETCIRKKSINKLGWKKYKRMNDWNCALFQKAYEQKKDWSFSIKKVNPLVGFGIFTNVMIPELSFIGEYAGI